MKKLIVITAIISLSFAEVLLPKKEADRLLLSTNTTKKLVEAEKAGKIKILGVAKNEDFYIIGIKTNRSKGYVYLTKDKKYLVMGNVLNADTGLPYQPKAISLINKEIVKKGVSFIGGNPNAKQEIYVVIDPECPYCKQFENQKGKIYEKNFKINYILFPLSFHKNAKAKSLYILAGKTNKEKERRLKAVMNGSNEWRNVKFTPQQRAKLEKELKKARKAVEELGARGTPSVYNGNFQSIR